MRLVNLKPPLIACLLLALSGGLQLVLPQASRRQFACVICGVMAMAIGFGVLLWAWGLFRKSGTPTRPTAQATALVTSGPFRFSRNPRYLAIVVMLLGLAVWVGSLPVRIAPVGFLAVMSLVFIPDEERRLRETVAEAYRAVRKLHAFDRQRRIVASGCDATGRAGPREAAFRRWRNLETFPTVGRPE